jgi:hypothetical protein
MNTKDKVFMFAVPTLTAFIGGFIFCFTNINGGDCTKEFSIGFALTFSVMLFGMYVKREEWQSKRARKFDLFNPRKTITAHKKNGEMYYRWYCPECHTENNMRHFKPMTYTRCCIKCYSEHDIAILKK